MIAVSHYLALASIIFVIGIFGVFLNKKNIISRFFMCFVFYL